MALLAECYFICSTNLYLSRHHFKLRVCCIIVGNTLFPRPKQQRDSQKEALSLSGVDRAPGSQSEKWLSGFYSNTMSLNSESISTGLHVVTL